MNAVANLEAFAKRIGRAYPVGMERKVIARERLVWCALNRVTNLDGYAVEFVLGVAEDAGVAHDYPHADWMVSLTMSGWMAFGYSPSLRSRRMEQVG